MKALEATTEQQKQWLEAFIVNNTDLEELENRLAEFNIFEAIGAVRQELRHSDFLAFLLDPTKNHQLDDLFLKRFLKQALVGVSGPAISAIDIDVADLGGAEVFREWHRHGQGRIDILIRDQSNSFIFVIENKIDTTEHSGQLKNYYQAVRQEFPNYRAIFIYLTPEGDEPSYDAYIAFSYTDVADLIEAIAKAYASTLGQDITILMTHYVIMLRRYIVSDSDIAQLCQKIYARHKAALDLIYEHRPDLQTELAEHIEQLFAKVELEYDLKRGEHIKKSSFYFYDRQTRNLYDQLLEQGWGIKYWPIKIEFRNRPNNLELRLRLITSNPVPIPQIILDHAKKHPSLFKRASGALGNYPSIWRRFILKKSDYEDSDLEAMSQKVKKEWQHFLQQDLPSIWESLSQIKWDELAKQRDG